MLVPYYFSSSIVISVIPKIAPTPVTIIPAVSNVEGGISPLMMVPSTRLAKLNFVTSSINLLKLTKREPACLSLHSLCLLPYVYYISEIFFFDIPGIRYMHPSETQPPELSFGPICSGTGPPWPAQPLGAFADRNRPKTELFRLFRVWFGLKFFLAYRSR